MEYRYWDLRQLPRGAVVQINLIGNAANVFLVDSSNFQAYRSGRNYRYYGGLARQSPVQLTVPHSGHWYAVVTLGGLPGRVNATVQVLPGAMPAIKQHTPPPISSLVQPSHLTDDYEDDTIPEREFDVFISHATEDKDGLVRPLADALVSHNLNVWYDEFELKLGDSLRRKIDAGLANSRFGVVVLSHAFFAKNWPQYELDGLVSREMTGEQVILPLWHKISKSEVIAKSPSLADKVARNTSDFTVNEIAKEIAEVILGAN